MEQQTKVTVRQSGAVVVIDIEGDLTSFTNEPVEKAYQQASDQGDKKILLAFREKDYINSAGIAIIIDLVSESQKKGEQMRIAQPSDHFRKIFTLVGLTQHVEVFPSVEQALEGF